MKETNIAKAYVEVLAIEPSSEVAQQLIKYRVPSKTNPHSGDFGTAVYLALKDRQRKESNITVAQVNDFLDTLAVAPDNPQRKAVLKQMLHETTALQQKWIVRVILKDLKMGSGEKLFLNFLHPDAVAQYNVTSNLRKVCEELTDRSVRAEDKMVQLFSSLKPMLAAALDPKDVLQKAPVISRLFSLILCVSNFLG